MLYTWKLTKIASNTIYTQDRLTFYDLLNEMFDMLGYAHHGCLQNWCKMINRERVPNIISNADTYKFVFDFDGDKVIYIFERVVNDEKNTTINSD